ncbi:DASH family cryptochrome [Stieleria sp. ICT_E10.1]|uniref:DASH family cryptochrome n=1 Tax=Stieleria sedimenti TaxID=2976331 RepID=UPI00217F7A88|nr:DASH family cryptochrome [Stieleria sedimenti]MCS7466203.1 DASH family cryptochrome [Stieleria sedimenti]
MPHHLVWFRNDLRLHDHPPLVQACRDAQREGGSVLPIYVLDPRSFAKTSFGFDRVGPHRIRFLRQALHDLSENLDAAGSRLHLFVGHPERLLPKLIESLDVAAVYFHREIAPEENSIQERVGEAISAADVPLHIASPCTLYAIDDLPFPIDDIPEVFSKFRRKVENRIVPPRPLDEPNAIPAANDELSSRIGSVEIDQIPQLQIPEPRHDERAVMRYVGGETAGLQRIETYIWQLDQLRHYKQTRNGMLRADDSSKFSPWLATGCISARRIHQEVCRYEQQRVKNESTYWLVFELLWRDYFACITAKHGAHVFQTGGLRQQTLPWREHWAEFDRWRLGQTGYPLIDANLQELSATGFMSNRGRQNVASFLTKNLGIDWRMGAEWFESMLIDYDPCSNYGNWNYAAGVGNDARGFRWFNTLKQSADYDPNGDYVRHWLPVLAKVPNSHVHRPWEMSRDQQQQFNCMIGVDYPNPIVDLFASAKHNETLYRAAVE